MLKFVLTLMLKKYRMENKDEAGYALPYKRGSIDAKVPIQEYITKLVKEGFDGMLVTDHNSYDGYRKFEKIAKNLHLEKPFTVLKGIEYDTRDGGHVIAVPAGLYK